MGTEKPYIVTWRELAEQMLGWDNSSNWGDYDFEKLSELIFEKTNTRLSVSTLKRIWGKVKYDSTPTIITLNSLALFLGFADWRQFKRHTDDARILEPAAKIEKEAVAPLKKVSKNKFQTVALSVTMAVGVLYLLLSLVANKKSVPDRNFTPQFTVRVVSDKMPNSVVFNYDASGYHSDSVYIQQSWDSRRREQVSGSGKKHTSIYYIPGYFDAKLVVDGQIKKEQPVFIKTGGWLGLIDKSPVPSYLNSDSIHMPNALGVTGQTFARIKGLPVFNDSWALFYNVREFGGLAGNNFSFEATVRNTSTQEQSSCRKMLISVIGSGNGLSVPLADKGCIAALSLYTGEKDISGKEFDLSAFGCDFSNFQHIACSVKDHKFMVCLNGKIIFADAVRRSIGEIRGIMIGFEGAGEIKNVKLGDDKHVVYQEDFSKAQVVATKQRVR
ncbi:MAG: hypothetical protein ACTHMI_13525 [Mucilaginibacter sp.]